MHSLIRWSVPVLSRFLERLWRIVFLILVRRGLLHDDTWSFVSMQLHDGHMLVWSLSMSWSFLFVGKHLWRNFCMRVLSTFFNFFNARLCASQQIVSGT